MTMNIWHDIDPKRISPDDFIAVIEIPKAARLSTSWTRKQVCSKWTASCTPQLTILPTTALFPVPTQQITTRWMYWFYAPKTCADDLDALLPHRRYHHGGQR